MACMLLRGSRGARMLSVAALLFAVPFVAVSSLSRAQGVTARSPRAGGFTHPEPIDFDNHEGWTSIFDGTSLKNWDGPTDVWHVADGAIVGESSDAHPSGTTNLIWRGGEPGNFRLKLEMKLEGTGANGGVQYRSHTIAPRLRPIPTDATAEMRARMEQGQALAQRHAQWNMTGYQMDFDFSNRYTGQMYEQDSPRGIIAWRGDVVVTEAGRKATLLGTVGSSDELKNFLKPGEWNQVEIVADGHLLTHLVNGHVMSVLLDTDPAHSQAKGLIALEIEGSGALKVSHRNIWLKMLP